jgi:hypothetical protein
VVSVFEMLDQEWRRLRRDRAAAASLSEVCVLAGGATTLAGVEDYVREAGPEDADAVLLALVRRAVTGTGAGGDLSARVLLQLLLPGTRNLARRWWSLGDLDERASAAVAAVYGRIRRYPLARRPGRVAANVLLDAARDLRRSVPSPLTSLAADPTVFAGEALPAECAASELADVLSDAVADGLIDLRDAQLIAQTRIAGHRVADLAHRSHQGSRTLWDRRQRAEQRLSACA